VAANVDPPPAHAPSAVTVGREPPGEVLPPVLEMLAHPLRSLKFVGAVLADRRVHPLRKLAFVVPLAVLLGALIAPETLLGALASVLAPIIGTVLSIPVDAAVDWVVVGLLGYGLLRVFPKEILREHHLRIFHGAQGR
jgi:hypothetical protein